MPKAHPIMLMIRDSPKIRPARCRAPNPRVFSMAEFADPLPRRHGHGVRHNGEYDDNHHEGDELDRRDDGVGHGDEAHLEGLFRFRERFREGVLEGSVDVGSHFRRKVRVFTPSM